MTDIIDLFLGVENVGKMNRIFGGDSVSGQKGIRGYSDALNSTTQGVTQPCGMRRYMQEFIHSPYMEGIYDIWTGTDADLYLRHMNDEFIKYMEIRYQRLAQMPCAVAGTPSARVEIASYLDPFDMAREQERRVEMAQPRRPIIRGTGASTGGARPGTIVDHGSFYRARGRGGRAGTGWSATSDPQLAASGCAPTSCSLPKNSAPRMPHAPGVPPLDCRCAGGMSGAKAVSGGHGRARVDGPESRPGALVDELYSRWNRDQMGVVHLASRDDEAADVGQLSYTKRFAYVPNCAMPPYDMRESNPWLRDPVAMSGDAQYHLLVLDSQMAVLNQEKTIPLGYGTTEDQLADDARIAARYEYRDRMGTAEEGVIPKTSYKKLTRGIDPMGRVTLSDDYKLATDIMSRDSKGFILSGRR